jgi:hypothetical protein
MTMFSMFGSLISISLCIFYVVAACKQPRWVEETHVLRASCPAGARREAINLNWSI